MKTQDLAACTTSNTSGFEECLWWWQGGLNPVHGRPAPPQLRESRLSASGTYNPDIEDKTLGGGEHG